MVDNGISNADHLGVPRRKPVPLRHARSTPNLHHQSGISSEPPKYEDLFFSNPYVETSIPRNKPEPTITVQEPERDFDEQLKDLVLVTESQCEISDQTYRTQPLKAANRPSARLEGFKAAVEDAKHFAGGLIPHPFEATKHYAILRHSLGVVYYRGLSTRVTITVFSDRTLPACRQLWLQRRGFSGKTGLAIGAAVGAKSNWLDVTPVDEVTVDQLCQSDERAWQRDIKKFLSKAKDTKTLCNHRACETLMIRVPFACQDGYFRIVLCEGNKVLCPSPVFRCASTSCDPSVLRGASLRTLPLELGVKAGAMVVNKYTAVATAAAPKAATSTLRVARSVTKLDAANTLPLHWLGIRSEAMLERDAEVGNGGLCVRR